MNDEKEKESQNDSWSGRIGDQKQRLKQELDASGKTARDFIADLLNLWEIQRKTQAHDLDHLPELKGIEDHLGMIQRLARSLLVSAKDEIFREQAKNEEVTQSLNETIIRTSQEIATLRNQLQETLQKLVEQEAQNAQISARLAAEIESNQTFTKALQRLEKQWDEAKHRIEAAETMEGELRMKNLQLTAANDEKARLSKRLTEIEASNEALVKIQAEAIDKLRSEHKNEIDAAHEWAEIKLQKALIEQKNTDLSTIQSLRERINELMNPVPSTH